MPPETENAVEEQEEPSTEQEQDTSLSMSDEDFLNAGEPDFADEPKAEIQEEEKEESKPEVEEEVEEEPASEDTNTQDTEKVSDQGETATSEDVKKEGEDTSGKKDADVPSEIDYKAEYDKLLTPFRANHKDIQIGSVDDALNLMKMGANYNKKMAGLKPNLKLMKMLENNDLLDEAKLSYLIDLNKKNPEAVTKLIKDSGLDPLDVDTKKESNYKPNTYTVNDKEVELDAVLDDIRDTASFKDTIDIVTNKLDEPSKQILLNHPGIISTINGHVQNGVYGQIMHVMENERMMGRLTDMNDLQAYKHIGDTINANGGFNQQPQPEGNPVAPVQQQDDSSSNNQADESKRIAKKKAASGAKGTTAKAKKQDFNPLNMSDEDFEKATAGVFL